MERLQFEGDSWRISDANKNYKLCPTYPPYLIVPSCINDETLECVAKFRSSRRIPAVVWRSVEYYLLICIYFFLLLFYNLRIIYLSSLHSAFIYRKMTDHILHIIYVRCSRMFYSRNLKSYLFLCFYF